MPKTKRNYLKDGDRVYATGCYLVWDKDNNTFIFDQADDDIYFDEKIVNFEDMDKPFTGE